MIRSRLILPLPLNFWLGCMLIAFLLTAHKVIKFFGKRKVALQEGTSLPGIPYAALFLSLLLLLSLGASTLKGLDTLTAQGTIIAQRIDVRTGPSAEDNSIFELSEGVSVHLLATRQQWTLIRHFDGIQGWIPNSSLLQTQGPQL